MGEEGSKMRQGALRFLEVQRFRQNPIAAVAGIAVLAGLVGSFACGVNAASLILLVVFGAVGFLLFFGELRTEVRDDGLYARLFPLTRQQFFAWPEIRSFEARTYRPILEYGGWGLRYGRNGKAYNVRGNRGVQLEFTTGKRLLIGSQRANELAAVMRDMCGR